MTPKEFSFHYVSAHELDVASGTATLHIDFLQGEGVHIYLEPCPKDRIEIEETPVLTPFPVVEVEDGIEVDIGYSKLHVGFDLSFKLIREGTSFTVRHEKDGEDYRLRFPLPEATHIYGLGDKFAPLNRRGYRYRNWNTDESKVQHEWSHSLYKSLNYLLLNEEGTFLGLYFPSTFPYTFDLGKTKLDELEVVAEKGYLDLYLFCGKTPKEITSSYSRLLGHPYFIRLKMLGNNQSRWSYGEESSVEEVARRYRENNLPLDYIHLDIDYMDGYRDFTVNPARFPSLKDLSKRLKEKGIELVAINDAGVKVDPEYPLYQVIVDHNWALLDEAGKPYVGEVWPGDAIFPSYIHPDCQSYLASVASAFLEETEVSGIWNDMNEPASFKGELPLEATLPYPDREVTHLEAHNLIGEAMSRSYVSSFTSKNLRPYLFSRAYMATTPKYAFAWNGDNGSFWHHLRLSLPQIMSCSLSNLMFDGVDIGGFNYQCTKELLIRWYEGNLLMPFFRNHSSWDARPQEPYAFDEETTAICRKYLNIRYALVPYLYNLAQKMAEAGEMMVRPLFYNYPKDKKSYDVDDEYMVGEDVLLAPILSSGTYARAVYLPEGEWVDYFKGSLIQGGRYILAEMGLGETGIYIRNNTVIPEFESLLHLDKENIEEIVFHIYGNEGECDLYEDDGKTLNYRGGEYNLYHASYKDGVFALKATHQGYASPFKRIKVKRGDKEVVVPFEANASIKI